MKGIILILCGMIGYLLSRFIPDGPLAVYAPMMISYHLYLAFVVVTTVQDKGISLSIGSTLLTHFAFLVLLVVMVQAHDYIPYFWLARFFIPGLAPFEAAWLFSGKAKRGYAANDMDAPTGGTAEDYEDFILYMRQSERPFAKPGHSVKQEFKSWLAYRSKHQHLADSGQRPA
jgi:hypothetical protein